MLCYRLREWTLLSLVVLIGGLSILPIVTALPAPNAPPVEDRLQRLQTVDTPPPLDMAQTPVDGIDRSLHALLSHIKKQALQIDAIESLQRPDEWHLCLTLTGDYAAVYAWLEDFIRTQQANMASLLHLEIQPLEQSPRLQLRLTLCYPAL